MVSLKMLKWSLRELVKSTCSLELCSYRNSQLTYKPGWRIFLCCFTERLSIFFSRFTKICYVEIGGPWISIQADK